MTNTGSSRATGETTIGNQGHLFTESHTHDIGGGSKHLLHAGAATWAFVANDHHVALLHLPIEDARAGLFLRIVDTSRPNMAHHRGRNRADFDHRTIRGKVAEEYSQAAAFAMRAIDGANHLVVAHLSLRDILAERFQGDGQTIQVESAGFLCQFVQDGADAASAVNVLHVPLARWADLAQVWRAHGNGIDPLERIIDTSLTREGKGMQDGIGRAAHRHIQREGVINALLVHDLTRSQIGFDEAHNLLTGPLCQFAPFLRDGEIGAVAGQSQPKRLHQAVHGISGEHAGAGAAGWTGLLFQFQQFTIIDLARLVRAHTLKNTNEVNASPICQLACRHRATTDEDGRNVQAHRGHKHPRYDLIAVGNADHTIEAVGLDHGFDAVGNQFAAGQRVLHADMAHRDTVIYADSIELERHASRCANGLLHQLAKGLQVNMPRHHVYIRVAHGDEGLVEVLLADNSGSAEQAAMRGALKTHFD